MPKKQSREMVRFGSVIRCATLAGESPLSARNQMVTRARFERATPSFGGCSGNPVTYWCCSAIRKTWFGPVVPGGAIG
jgi:hypothetical protein